MALLFLPLMFLALWAIVILPQQRRMRSHQSLVSALREGDEVMTTSGIFGTITAIDDEVLHLKVAPAVTLRVVRAAIARRLDEPEPVTAPPDAVDDAVDAATMDAAVDAATADEAPAAVDAGDPAGASAEGEQSGPGG